MSAVKQRYTSRKPGTNPRTGEALVPWEQVQVQPVNTPAWGHFYTNIHVKTDEGCRIQRFKVRARAQPNQGPDKLYILGLITARNLGFIPTNADGVELDVPRGD